MLRTLGNISLVERPTRLGALASTVVSALRAREKQYQIRDYLEQRERAGEALLENSRRKDEFLATLAHELRNPLAPILNATQLLGAGRINETTVRWARDVLERQARQLVRLVDDLLDISRITRGKVELRKERVDLASIVRSSIETSRPLMEAAQHELEVSLPEAPIELEADAARLAQVLGNLLNNAAKYTPARGRISLSVERASHEAVIRVRDTGIGIPQEMLSRVFEMFLQVEDAIERTQGGLGIGLTLVRRFVEMHGGTVTVVSGGKNRGSEFTVRLPLLMATAAAAANQPQAAPGGPTAPHCRILIVEDNTDGAQTLSRLLVLAGHDVRVARDGISGVESVEKFKPDVVLMDIGLPELNGYEAARRIRQGKHGRNVTLIAMTGWGQAEDQRRARQAGFDLHFVKPLELSALQEVLQSLDACAGGSGPGAREPVTFTADRAS